MGWGGGKGKEKKKRIVRDERTTMANGDGNSALDEMRMRMAVALNILNNPICALLLK
jgi:hypothetical protein